MSYFVETFECFHGHSRRGITVWWGLEMLSLTMLASCFISVVSRLRWLNTVLRAVSGNSRNGECFNLEKQTWRRKSNGTQKTISQNLLTSALGGQIFAVTKSKNSAYCRVNHFKVLHFQRLFSLPRIKLVLKWCKAHNFGPSKATHI